MNIFDLLPSVRRQRLTAYINGLLKTYEALKPNEEHCFVADLTTYTIEDIATVTGTYKKDYTIRLVRISVPFKAFEIYMKAK